MATGGQKNIAIMNKKFILTLLAFVLSLTSWAQTKINGIYYELDASSKTASVTSGDDKYSGEVTIPSTVSYEDVTYSVTSIGNYAFSSCSGLISVTIPNSVTSIGNYAFFCCSGLISVTIPNSVTSIGHDAFWRCSGLMSVIIPNSLKIIEYDAFEECSSLTSIEIPNSVTSIESSAFSSCTSLTSITIGNSVTSIGINPFSSCSSLTSITVDAGNSVYDSRENCNAIIETSSNTLVVGCKKSTIPNSVTGIGEDAFSGCFGLTSIILPNHVTRIGDSAFHSCSSLADIYALRSDPSQYGCDTWAFYGFNTSTCTLHVPTGCKESYASADPWRYFKNIVEEDLTGIEEMEMKSQDAAYYNLNGQRITQLQRGINIVRYKDGTSRKMLVK